MSSSFEMKKITNKNKELLKKELNNLSHTEFCEVFNIIRTSTDRYSENSNGVFINLKYIDDSTVQKIWDFINFSKNSKMILNTKYLDLSSNNTKKNNSGDNKTSTFSLDKNLIQKELTRLKSLNTDAFSFQNFLEKLSSNNLKHFPTSDKIIYPTLKTNKNKFDGVKARLLKKCRDVNRNIWDSNNINLENNKTTNEDNDEENEVNDDNDEEKDDEKYEDKEDEKDEDKDDDEELINETPKEPLEYDNEEYEDEDEEDESDIE